ncbi:MAG: sigma-70 family RNA polymerase sigma factor [Gemmatimonadetes bacterium]|nr:sigma-70 family RNA polymerase sigma factor [Gemmatimonadota bacterium]MBT8404468.1 sigma-70 family RNA polymerase sigma factor [Gemmatimonadota bacterium]NNF39562.1 sigma-70 family RNA polymerase sigma factor [Gemmatimonadota bacterium]NNK62948.1 sigma-70 family RNA polymerase sigma factor [Gemmatimonadota bacterium]
MPRQPLERPLRTEPAPAPLEKGTRTPTRRTLPHDFEAWYEQHRPVVYRYVRFRVATREAAEDVTSDVFMKALRSIERYDATLASPRTWLLRIARNAVTDHLRALRRRGSLHVSLDRVPDLVADVPSQDERVLRQERIQTLLNGTQTLRKADQEILSLRYGGGLGNSEIAEALGISNNAVAVRLHRALKRLKEAVEDLRAP